MKKLGLLVILLLSMLLVFASCSDKDEEEDAENVENGGKYTSMEIFETVSSAMKDMPDMITSTDEDEGAEDIFLIFSELEYDKVKDYVFCYSSEGYADEIIVVQVKDNADAKEVKEDLEERLESRKSTFATYNAEEGTKFNAATVLSKGNYVSLLIGNQAQNGKYEFNKLFKD